jgi:hypothetical protein
MATVSLLQTASQDGGGRASTDSHLGSISKLSRNKADYKRWRLAMLEWAPEFNFLTF